MALQHNARLSELRPLVGLFLAGPDLSSGKAYFALVRGRFMALGTQEFIIIGLGILVLFGATAIPKLARSLGRAQGEFQKARSELQREMQAGAEETTDVGPSEAHVRQTARELGIDDSGMDLPAVKQAINEKLA